MTKGIHKALGETQMIKQPTRSAPAPATTKSAHRPRVNVPGQETLTSVVWDAGADVALVAVSASLRLDAQVP